MLTRTTNAELLAPAGDWDALRAACANGADAVYFGLSAFNARHRAANFTPEELPKVIDFLHARNVRGTASHFVETWHDNGEIDMPAVIRALKQSGYRGTLRPDHAPSMAGETNESPGYEMLGRLFAAGYLRGLMQAA